MNFKVHNLVVLLKVLLFKVYICPKSKLWNNSRKLNRRSQHLVRVVVVLHNNAQQTSDRDTAVEVIILKHL